MATYVMSDLHGCYTEFMDMLRIIRFSEQDLLILAGDYIDRGTQNYEMLNWLLHTPNNICLLKGNHDKNFALDVYHLLSSVENAKACSVVKIAPERELIESYGYCRHEPYFDVYGTLKQIMDEYNPSWSMLKAWADKLNGMDLQYEITVNGRDYIIVHAGICEDADEDYKLWEREHAYLQGGIPGKTVIAGHTPTNIADDLLYNHGKVFFLEHDGKRFYDIDCGYVYKDVCEEYNMACIRLEDEKIFYLC
ncbi:MAG: metallophosphoesterase [Lachnospiraceae bacterium]